jgi:hypothetical protein
MTNDRMTNDGMRHQPQRARRAQSEEFITKTHRRERGERRDFLEYCSAYSAVSAIKNPFCSGVYFEFATNFTNWHEFFLLIRVNSCNSWQKRPTAQFLSVFGIRHEFHELARIFSLNSCKFVQFVAKKTNCATPECFKFLCVLCVLCGEL